MEHKISAKAFAEFVTGGPSKKAATVRGILKPKLPSTFIPSGYYKRAIAIIRGYHDQGNNHAYVTQELKNLYAEAESASTPQSRTNRLSNAQAVTSYMRIFSGKTWKVTRCPRIYFSSNGILISGKPDLAVQDGDRLRLVKLGVRKKKELEVMVRLMLRVVYQAAFKEKLRVNPQDITFFDVKSGETISGTRADSSFEKRIEEGCRLLQQMLQASLE